MHAKLLVMNLKRVLLFVCFQVFVLFAIAQTQNPEVRKINGKKYIIHKVEKGNTIYAISKLYNVTVDEIKSENPGIEQGLSIGQEVKVPYNKADLKEVINNERVLSGRTLYHTVQAKETLYGISTRYKITIDELKQANPALAEGLKEGQQLVIPQKNNKPAVGAFQETVQPKDFITHEVLKGETLYSLLKIYNLTEEELTQWNPELANGLKVGMYLKIPVKTVEPLQKTLAPSFNELNTANHDSDGVFTVAIFLPFYLDLNDTLQAKLDESQPDAIYNKSDIALQFYKGIKIALDSLSALNKPVKATFYETANDTNVVKRILQRAAPSLKNVDLIVGPLYRKNLELIAEFSKANGIPQLSPVPQNNRVLLGNAQLSKLIPSDNIAIKQEAHFVHRKYSDTSNVFVLNSNLFKDRNMVASFTDRYNKLINSNSDSLVADSIKVVTMDQIIESKLKWHLDTSKLNVVIIPSNDRAYVTTAFVALNNLRETYKIQVFGTPDWFTFDNIDVEYWHNLKVHFPANYHVNYSNAKTKKFIKNYRETFSAEPQKYAFYGFDLTMYYANIFNQNLNLYEYYEKHRTMGISIGFDFFKTSVESGWENKYLHMVTYVNFKLVNAY